MIRLIRNILRYPSVVFILVGLLVLLVLLIIAPRVAGTVYERGKPIATSTPFFAEKKSNTLDTADYDRRMELLANYPTTTPTTTPRLWPVKDIPYPKMGAILPFKRIIAYYGNFYSKNMGVLGEYPEDVMLGKLRAEEARWETADPETPVMPAINYIAITAQELPGREHLYMLRMPDSQIDKALEIAKKIDAIVILDIQIGFSTLEKELPLLEKYLAMPNVHLGLDPEFHMIGEESPGHVIGSFDARDINYASEYLANLVRTHDLPPKVIVVHRFTQRMVTNYQNIAPLPEVQIVMDMDGWGPPAKKINTYKSFIYPEPVQFTGFKIFYKNDLKPPSTRLLTPEDLLELTPRPSFIQYQ
jgi:hypothetical protein